MKHRTLRVPRGQSILLAVVFKSLFTLSSAGNLSRDPDPLLE